MAHILTIIPKNIRTSNKVKILSCMGSKAKNIQQKLDCAAKVKKQLEADIFERENRIKQSADAAKQL